MRKRILIIEDNVDLQEIYKSHFEAHDFVVDLADNGVDGVTRLVEKQPDCILLDIMMPQMNGFEVLSTIKNQSSFQVPIIVCSNSSQKSDIDRTYDLWADLFLQKSEYQGEDLVKKVSEFIAATS